MSIYPETQSSQRARESVYPLAERLRIAEQVEPYSRWRWDGDSSGRAIFHLDDFSGIPFLVEITGVEEYQHRARLRARQGEAYAAVTPPTVGYEAYCGRYLGLEPVEMISAGAGGRRLELGRSCADGRPAERLIEIAKKAGGLLIHPFMGIEAIWELAESIAESADVEVRVAAPPPPITWLANDKSLFAEVVTHTLGPEWLVESQISEEVTNLAVALKSLAQRYPRVALKRLRCASAMGNRVFDGTEILQSSDAEVGADVQAFLDKTDWDGREAVLAVAWEPSEHSPSTQLWIPPDGTGEVRLEGIYEQLLAGERRVFVGSRPTTLADSVNQRLASASLQVASALQYLGYVGRCSFDFILCGDPDAECQPKFTECNGRWGGPSTPMALMDRLFPQGRPPYRARDFVHPDLEGVGFGDLLAVVGAEAWDYRSGKGKYLFYNTGPMRGFGKLDVIAIGATQSEADDALEEDLPRLLGLS